MMTDATVNEADAAAEPGETDLKETHLTEDEDQADAPSADLDVSGAALADEELAAVTAVLGTLAAAADESDNGAGSAGPTDRTLQRRRRLGLWGRPGPDSWKHAAGLR